MDEIDRRTKFESIEALGDILDERAREEEQKAAGHLDRLIAALCRNCLYGPTCVRTAHCREWRIARKAYAAAMAAGEYYGAKELCDKIRKDGFPWKKKT